MIYYELLQVPKSATRAEIVRAYRRAAARLHPDRNSAPDAAQLFDAVTKAYNVLRDPKQRAEYDKSLEGVGSLLSVITDKKRCESCKGSGKVESSADDWFTFKVACPDCKGSGYA